MVSREVRQQARGTDERRDLDACARDCWRLPGYYRRPAVPQGGLRFELSYLSCPGGTMRKHTVEKIRWEHPRGRDYGGARSLAPKCAGCNATPVETPGSGYLERPSPNTALYRVGGARPCCGESTISLRTLRLASKDGDVQSSESACLMQTLPALRAYTA
jgi:hypothetical protein